MQQDSSQLSSLRTLTRLFIVAVVLNYAWEIAQGIFFVGMNYKKGMWLHCFVASLGDGLLICIIHLVGWSAFHRADWFAKHGSGRWIVMITTGLVIGVSVEWVAVHLLGRWTYTAQMPLVPGLGIGIIPILQMLILPPLIFEVVVKLGVRKQVAFN
jgi:hypothetical protein